jgi:L-rhamnose isomerase
MRLHSIPQLCRIGGLNLPIAWLGDKAKCMVDLNTMRRRYRDDRCAADVQQLGGFHFNDSKYGDDLDTSIDISVVRVFI